MAWHRITNASSTYVLDPERMIVKEDDGRILTPAELVASWRQAGTVERLTDGVDPEAVMRQSWVPRRTTRGGNIGL